MKKMLVLSTLSFGFFYSMTGNACVDFSGTYKYEGSTVVYQIKQDKCDSVIISVDDYTTKTIADGNYHVASDQPIIIDGEVIGNLTISRRAKFTDKEFLLDTKSRRVEYGETQDLEIISVNTLSPTGDYVSTFTSSHDGVTRKSIAKKIK